MKQFSPAAERNRGPILEVLKRVLPARGLVLEIGSGTGQHAAYFARELPALDWQPSDPNPSALSSIEAWSEEACLPNLRPPLTLDVTTAWPDIWIPWKVDAVLSCNMIHIAPWAACEGLLRGAARVLNAGAPLLLYGPFVIPGRPTAPSNLEFDEWLKSENPAWGVRDLSEVLKAAEGEGFRWEETVAMPANNFVVVLRRQ
jgi:cyclopropane fatty-acyl-phospholipid synthase-like methyltransferase